VKKVIVTLLAVLTAGATYAAPPTAKGTHFPLIADQWYRAAGLSGGANGGSPSTQVTVPEDWMVGFASYISQNNTSFDEVAVYVNSAKANAEATLCVYEMGSDGLPTSVPVDESNAIDLGTTGKRIQGTSSTITLNQGWHVFMLSFNTDYTGDVDFKGTNSRAPLLGADEVDGSTQQDSWYRLSNDYSVDPCPDLTSATIELSPHSHCYGSTCQYDSFNMPAFYLQKE